MSSGPVYGVITEKDGLVYYVQSKQVFRAPVDNVIDTQTGLPIGRWECSLESFRRFSESVYGIKLCNALSISQTRCIRAEHETGDHEDELRRQWSQGIHP